MEETSKQVLDGGALMYKVWLEKNITLKMNFVGRKFGQCAVVFDGYGAGPSTKDHEHCRRSVKNRGTVEFILNEETKIKANQEAFFWNEQSKVYKVASKVFNRILNSKELKRRCWYRNC